MGSGLPVVMGAEKPRVEKIEIEGKSARGGWCRPFLVRSNGETFYCSEDFGDPILQQKAGRSNLGKSPPWPQTMPSHRLPPKEKTEVSWWLRKKGGVCDLVLLQANWGSALLPTFRELSTLEKQGPVKKNWEGESGAYSFGHETRSWIH